MIRKLVGVLLSVVLCLVLVAPVLAQQMYSTIEEYEKVTGGKMESFSEAPMLRTKVAAGELPPLQQRLPEEPLVVEPVEEIGLYGGAIHAVEVGGPSGGYFTRYWFCEPSVQMTPDDLKGTYPNRFKDVKHSNDFKTWTLFLRKGMRWSDGYPLTADDMMFWYKDEVLNDDLTPVKPVAMMRGGKLATMEKVDDYAVRFHFAAPFPDFETIFLTVPECFYLNYLMRPRHYLEKYHIKYNSKADELAQEEGFDHWYQLYRRALRTDTIGRPTVEAWILKILTPTHATFERNPYYWKIDTAGNQLPYIDRIEVKSIASMEAYKMALIGGESDFAVMFLSLEDFPLLKKNEEKGNYEVRLWVKNAGSGVAYMLHQGYEDPVIRKLYEDIRFRRALSLAINREEINKLLYFEKGIPAQAAVPPTSKYYVPEAWQAYAQYDPEEANQLLDEMGLKWNKEHTYRLRPDGEKLLLKIEGYAEQETPETATSELVKNYWEAVGVQVDFDFGDSTLFTTRYRANKVAVTAHVLDMLPDLTYQGALFDPISTQWFAPQEWYTAFQKGGRKEAEKEGASEDMIKFFELTEEFRTVVGEEEKIRVAKEISLLWSKNLWAIGTVGGSIPMPILVGKHLRNVPQVGFVSFFNFRQIPTIMAQYFISK